jgi:fatty acid desaturase
MATVQDFLSKEELQRLYQIDRWAIVRATLFTWGLIGVSLWAWAVTRQPLVLIVGFVVIATRQHALHNLVHEASHYSISRDRALNDWISDIVFAAPHFISTEGYRRKHLLHHQHLGNPELDTEHRPWQQIRGLALLKHSILALSGYQALVAVWSYRDATASGGALPIRFAALVALTNGAIAAYCFWLGTPWAYVYLWVLPLFTLTIYLDMLRVIAEHQTVDYAAGEEDPAATIPAFTRSIASGALERFVFGPVNFCFHLEHHLAPGVPFARLPELNRLLSARGFFSDPDSRLGQSYLGVLSQLARPVRTRGDAHPK